MNFPFLQTFWRDEGPSTIETSWLNVCGSESWCRQKKPTDIRLPTSPLLPPLILFFLFHHPPPLLLLFLLSSPSMTSVKRTSFPESFRSTRAKRRASRRPATSTVSTGARERKWGGGVGRSVCLRGDWSATGREVSWWRHAANAMVVTATGPR